MLADLLCKRNGIKVGRPCYICYNKITVVIYFAERKKKDESYRMITMEAN